MGYSLLSSVCVCACTSVLLGVVPIHSGGNVFVLVRGIHVGLCAFTSKPHVYLIIL